MGLYLEGNVGSGFFFLSVEMTACFYRDGNCTIERELLIYGRDAGVMYLGKSERIVLGCMSFSRTWVVCSY